MKNTILTKGNSFFDIAYKNDNLTHLDIHPHENHLMVDNFLAEYSGNPSPVLFNLGIYSKKQIHTLLDDTINRIGPILQEKGFDIELNMENNLVSITNYAKNKTIQFKVLTDEYIDILNNFELKTIDVINKTFPDIVNNIIPELVKKEIKETVLSIIDDIAENIINTAIDSIKQVITEEIDPKIQNTIDKIKLYINKEFHDLLINEIPEIILNYLNDIYEIVDENEEIYYIIKELLSDGMYLIEKEDEIYYFHSDSLYNSGDLVNSSNGVIYKKISIETFVDNLTWEIFDDEIDESVEEMIPGKFISNDNLETNNNS